MTATWWACVRRRLQAMDPTLEDFGRACQRPLRPRPPPPIVDGTWRGRCPTYAHQRWWLETRPERHDDWNTWIVFDDWDNRESGKMLMEVRWWGMWERSTEWSPGDYVDRTRNPPCWTVYSMCGLADIRVSAVSLVTGGHKTKVNSRHIKRPV